MPLENITNSKVKKVFNEKLNYTKISPYQEGANLDITKAFMTHKKAFKKEMRLVKKSIYDKDEALEHIKNAKKEIKQCKKIIKETNSSIGSTIFGFFADALIDMCDILLPISISKIGIKITASSFMNYYLKRNIADAFKYIFGYVLTDNAQYVTYLKGIIVLMREITGIVISVKDDKRNTVDKCNIYKNKILTYIMDLEAQVDKYEKYIKNRQY